MRQEQRDKIAAALRAYRATPEGHAAAVRAGSGNAGKAKIGNRDSNHWSWSGANVGYASIHSWVGRRLGRASEWSCIECGLAARDWANISHRYERDLNDWMPMCRSCHQTYDNSKAKSWIKRKEAHNA